MPHRIDGQPIIANGSIVLAFGQKLSLEPFQDDKSYRIEFDLKFYPPDEEEEIGIESLRLDPADSGSGSVLATKRPFKNNLSISTGRPVNFASDDDDEFFATFVVTIFGKPDNYTTIIDFTITSKGKV